MENTKLIMLIKSFTPEERKEFQKYIDSPFYNNETSISRFYTLLKKSAPEFLPKSIAKEKLYSKIYPSKPYNDVIMRNIISRTLKLAEDYITLKEFYNEPDMKALLKMKALGSREQAFLFEKAKKEAERIIEANPYRDESYYYSRMMYEDEVRKFTRRIKSVVFIENDNLQEITDNGVYFIATALLTLYAVMANQKKHLVDKEYDFSFMDKIMEYYEGNDNLRKIPYAGLYYNSIKLFNTEDEKYFKNVRDIIKDHYEDLKEVDRKNAYVVVVNYCSEKVNKGELDYLKTKLDLYKEIISKGAHYEGLNYISHVFYNRVAFTAINIGDLVWAKEFIDKFKDELNDEHRENSYQLAMAEYYLKKKEYPDSIECLSMVLKADYLYKQEVYTLSLKVYYSAGLDESFFAEIENYRNFLKTNKLVTSRKKELGLNFINLIKGLHTLKCKKSLGQKFDIYTIRKRIIENKYIVDKFWLLEKVVELEDDDGKSPIKREAV